MTSLADTDPEWIDWHYVPPAAPNLDAAMNMARQINLLDRKQLANYQDPHRAKHNQLVEVLQCMSNLKGDRTGRPTESSSLSELTGSSPSILSPGLVS